MKPQARVQATIDILEKTNQSRVPMDSVTGDYMRGRRYIGSKDRANVAGRVYDMTRAHARIGWHLDRAGHADTARARAIAWLALGEDANAKRIDDLFDGSKYAPAPLDENEKSLAQKLEGQPLDHADMDAATRTECPPAYAEKLQELFGADFETEMQAMLQPAALDMRANIFLADREKVQNQLRAAGIETDPTPYSPWGLRARGKAYLAKTKAFAKGWVEIQDEGSQLIACICDAQPGMQVLDYCAGAGGKTLALAAAMQRKGRIVAMDTDERRLEKGRDRFRKAQVADIIEVRPMTDNRHRKWLRRQKETFDVVLCDVPCSGTGTWRRNPDMRWHHYGPPLEELLGVQAEILERIASCVKPGGRLVYATCSLLADENEDQVEKFLSAHPEFSVLSPSVILSEAKDRGNGHQILQPLARLQDDTGKYMRLTPHRHGTDGFFAAVLRRE
jgi:16S rRNA (cytosine967-C5)-methyltransferase